MFSGGSKGNIRKEWVKDIYHDIPNSYFQISTQCEC